VESPPCIQGLLRGVKEGCRNEAARRIASYLLNYKREKPEVVWRNLVSLKMRNEPPLGDFELRNVFNSVLKGGYIYGCDDPLLTVFAPIGKSALFSVGEGSVFKGS